MKFIIYVVFTGVIVSSCGTQRKMEATREALSVIKEGQERENLKLGAVGGIAGTKMQEGRIDKNINSLIMAKLKKYKESADSVSKDAAAIETLLSDKKEFRKKYKTFVLPNLELLQKNNEQYADRLTLYLMVEDGLNIANYQLFDLAAFFGPGKYVIPDDKTELALVSFAPIVDSLILFSNKYNTIPRTATLIVLGFADGTGFSDDGPLFDTLTALIGKKDAGKEELNQKLSELRAKELSKQLTKVFFQKASSFINFDKIHIDYINQGKGEEYPLPYIKDYTTDDSRRRIVLCYWAVLPD